MRRVSWRVALGGLVAVLLPLPLVFLLSSVLWPDPPEPDSGGRRISPVLGTEARTRLSSYRRSCGLSLECEPPLGCVFDARISAQYCTDSQCTTDAQCPQEHACQNIATSGDGPLVRFCVPHGRRQEGERCLALPGDQESACAAGLVCGGQQNWCARPCRMDGTSACQEGFFCADTLPEPVCLPTCATRTCPKGQQCILFQEGASACAVVYGFNCQQVPCPEGRKCQVDQVSARPGEVWMECVERCGEGFSPCGSGMICDGWQCRPACTPQEPDPCGKGFRCSQRRPDRPVACQPDW